MRAIILCAGRGTRLKDMLGDTPKCLAEVGGQPVLAHILAYIDKMDCVDEIRIVVRPDDVAMICGTIFSMERIRTINFVVQPEPLGEGDAVWHGLRDVAWSSEPVLIILGDNIPRQETASEYSFFSNFREYVPTQGIALPDKSIICVKPHLQRNPANTTVLQLSRNYHVDRFIEVRNGRKLDGDWFIRSGMDYIRRGDILFDALDQYKRHKVTNAGEYRLTPAYQYLWHQGESFDTAVVHLWHCGTPESLEETVKHHELNQYMRGQWEERYENRRR